MKILITGVAGLLGRECSALLGQHHEIFPLTSRELDIADPDRVAEVLYRLAPDVVLNCAAFADVDACETQRDRAYAVNAQGPGRLAAVLARRGGRLIQISTDYVFDGAKPPPQAYTEEDAVNPLSWYARTKLEGEIAVQAALDDHLIVRTAWLYGLHGKNFLNLLLNLAVAKKLSEIRVVTDQFGTPTWAYRLARQLERLIEADLRGVVHATAEGGCSRYELAVAFFREMGLNCRVVPCPAAEFPAPAVRPRNTVLENRRLKDAGLNVMRPWEEDIREFVGLYKEQLVARTV